MPEEPCYDPFARYYDRWLALLERLMFRRWRRRLLARMHGPRVLEMAIGTGLNLPFYPPGIQLMRVDLSSKMLAIAAAKAQKLGINLEARVMDAQRLEFPDASFDSVVATFLFCNISSVEQGLSEMRRLCKPDGRVFLMEHVRPEGILGRIADRLDTWTSTRFCNEHINRRTVAELQEAGLQIVWEENHLRGIIKLVEARRDWV